MTLPIILFAAGLGTRMGALTADQPKPLIPVAGKPLLDHAHDLATKAGVGPMVVNLHYKGQMVRDHLAGHDVLFSDETDELLDTGGGLRRALPLLGASPVMTMNTDAVWNGPNPLIQIMKAWEPEMEALLLMVAPTNVHGHLGRGDFDIDDDGRLHRAPGAIYTGVQIIRTEALDEITDQVFSMNVVWDKIAARGGLYGALYDGQWCDVGQPASIPTAEAMLNV